MSHHVNFVVVDIVHRVGEMVQQDVEMSSSSENKNCCISFNEIKKQNKKEEG